MIKCIILKARPYLESESNNQTTESKDIWGEDEDIIMHDSRNDPIKRLEACNEIIRRFLVSRFWMEVLLFFSI